MVGPYFKESKTLGVYSVRFLFCEIVTEKSTPGLKRLGTAGVKDPFARSVMRGNG